MFAAILTIFQIIGALPSLIRTIIEIIKLIKELKTKEERVAARERLSDIAKRVKEKKQVSNSEQSELDEFLKELREKCGKGESCKVEL